MFHSNRTTRGWVAARKLVFSLSLALVGQCALAQAMYRIEPLGCLGGCITSVPTVVGLNGKGEVAGDACNAHGDSHAFKWRHDGTARVDLGPDEVGSWSNAVAINASQILPIAARARCGSARP